MGSGKSKHGSRKQDSRNSEQAGPRNRLFNLLSFAILGLLVVGFSVIAWNRCSRPANVTDDYEGVILDRWAGYIETDEGSRPYFRLLIEDDKQHRLTVNVNADTYHRSQVGMRVSRQKGNIKLTKAQAKPDK